ncbi:MAG: ribose-phosphate pyrophosphokinase [Elusimicrobia bacterium]|nr:ribose-phosphate pyrophosphokinase [Elusimicrobiota bacterium]
MHGLTVLGSNHLRKSEKFLSHDTLKIFSGNANQALALEICRYLRQPLGKARVSRFADDEINVQILENVRGSDCFIIQPTSRPVNENAMELLIMIDALRRASAGRITAVVPYFGYARADRKTEPRVPISAKLMANLITAAGADRVITIDLHVGQIQGFFDIPVDHLFAAPVFIEHLKKMKLKDFVMVSPDVGGVERTRVFAKRLNTSLVIIDKRRGRPNHATIYRVIGEIAGKTAVILDDIVDTAGTLTKVANALKQKGATRVLGLCTHGVLSGDSVELIEKSALEVLGLTNTIPISSKSTKITVLSIAPLLAEAICRNHLGQSISAMFA